MELAHRDEIEKARVAIRADPANATILDVTAGDEPTLAAAVTSAAVKATDQSSRSVARRIAALVEMGAVQKIGAGAQTAYRATGLV